MISRARAWAYVCQGEAGADCGCAAAESRDLVLVPYTGVPGPTVMIQRERDRCLTLASAQVALSCVPRTFSICFQQQQMLSVSNMPTRLGDSTAERRPLRPLRLRSYPTNK